MTRFRYWKLTYEEVEKLTYNPDNILNWDIKCTRGDDEDAKFFGVFLYRNGTPHDYETKKGLVYYYNNFESGNYQLSRQRYLEKRNKYAWWIGIIYVYAMIDAVVDAHLHSFNDLMESPIRQENNKEIKYAE